LWILAWRVSWKIHFRYNQFMGFDFTVFWNTGLAILQGRDPYSVHLSAYPPAMAYLYALFALLPLWLAFPIWCGANTALFLDVLRRRGLVRQAPAWLASAPVWFILFTGQIDIVFFWLAEFLEKGGWKAVIAAALTTLKPQLALVVLPWYLLRWLAKDRAQLLRWAGLCLLLHAFPLIFDPGIYARWFAAAGEQPGWRMLISTGVFLFANLGIPAWLLALPAVALAVWGLTRDEKTSRLAMLLAQPVGVWYMDVLLVGAAPWQIYLPVSLLAFVAGVLLKNSFPFVFIPLAVLAWRVSKKYQDH
jgi:hypothetical protein